MIFKGVVIFLGFFVGSIQTNNFSSFEFAALFKKWFEFIFDCIALLRQKSADFSSWNRKLKAKIIIFFENI